MLGNQNLGLACNVVRKIVIEAAQMQIDNDKQIKSEIKKRRGGKFESRIATKLEQQLPSKLCKKSKEILGRIEIYSMFYNQNRMFEEQSSKSGKKLEIGAS